MNVIILNDYAYINGGAGQVAISSAIALAEKGYNTFLFTAVGPISEEFKNIPNLKISCLQQHDILNDPNRLRAIVNGIWNRTAAKEFKKLLSTLDAKDTIVHVHTCSKALSSSCIKEAMTKGFNVIYHIHDYGVVCPNLGFYNYQTQTLCGLKPLRLKCLLTHCDSRSYLHKVWRCLRQYIQYQFGGVPSEIKNFITVSNFSYKVVQDFLPKGCKNYFVNNPINIKKLPPIEVASNKYFIFIGRLTPEKNPILLAKVAQKMQLPVMFIGDGPCSKEIQEIYPEAILTGWINSDEVQQYMQEAKCLVLTSSWYETQGMVVAEAAAKGIPAVVPSTCAASDYIIDGHNGLIFTSQDMDDLTEKLSKFNDKSLVEKMGQCAYEQFWREKPDMNSYVESINRVYQEILSKG
jgi:glycosyltransferase involved in cell wall biosynthesis